MMYVHFIAIGEQGGGILIANTCSYNVAVFYVVLVIVAKALVVRIVLHECLVGLGIARDVGAAFGPPPFRIVQLLTNRQKYVKSCTLVFPTHKCKLFIY